MADQELTPEQRFVIEHMADAYASVCVVFSTEYVTVYGYEDPEEGKAPDVGYNVELDGGWAPISQREVEAGPRYTYGDAEI
jgi:hypothetical protein